MDMNLTTELEETRDWARKLAAEKIAPFAKKHSEQKISSDLLQDLSGQGLMSLVIPESLGGLGLGALSFSYVIEEISKACGSVGVTVAVTNMIADVLVREGTPLHHEKYLKPLTDGRFLTASFCLTENQSGSDASAMKTTASKEGRHYRINGEKIYVTNGAFSGVFLVMAKTSDAPGSKGISAFLVPLDAKGLVLGKEEEKMGLTGSSTIRMSFENVMVPEEDRVGPEGEGFKIAMRALDGGRISVASQALGIARASLEEGVKYAKEREAFGKPIADFQAIQWKLADSATSLAAADLLVRRAAWLKDQSRPFTLQASQAKVFTTEAAVKVCEEVVQIHGGYGYIKEYPAERFLRDVRVTTLYEGTSEIQRMVIARKILGE